MIYKKIPLDENNDKVFLEAYIADKVGDFVRKAILVIPGGGYSSVCSDREGEPIALGFMPHGYNAFVLHYSVDKESVFPKQLIEASRAMKHIKDNAEEYNINPEKVFAVGFSAGGHLCGSLGILWHIPEIYEAIDMPYGYNKPAGAMLIYPVVSAKYENHISSFHNLLGTTTPTQQDLDKCSLEKHIDDKTVPIFLAHTSNDETVDVRNPLCLAEALKNAGHTFEMHIFPDAPHGFALGNDITACGSDKWSNPAIEKWIAHAAFWAENL